MPPLLVSSIVKLDLFNPLVELIDFFQPFLFDRSDLSFPTVRTQVRFKLCIFIGQISSETVIYSKYLVSQVLRKEDFVTRWQSETYSFRTKK